MSSAPPVRLAGFGSAAPHHTVGPEEVAALVTASWPDLAGHLLPLLDQSSGLTRRLVRSPSELAAPLSPAAQTAWYGRVAPALAEDAAREALSSAGIAPRDIGLLVVASCTGFVLPGVDVTLVSRLGLRADVARMPFTLLGCGGGAAGLARACEWVRGRQGEAPADQAVLGEMPHEETAAGEGAAGEAALVVAVELPSITFRPDDVSMDNLLSALVFADGAAAAVVTPGDHGLTVGRCRGAIVPGTRGALGYRLVDDGLQVVLSRRLPRLLGSALPELVAGFLGDQAVTGLDAVAIHPGGPAILRAVERSMSLTAGQTAASWTALQRSGNTSSAAILSVLAELDSSRTAMPGKGLAIGFGPGLSVELLELGWRC